MRNMILIAALLAAGAAGASREEDMIRALFADNRRLRAENQQLRAELNDSNNRNAQLHAELARLSPVATQPAGRAVTTQPAATRPATGPASQPATATAPTTKAAALHEALADWIALLEAGDLKTATKRWAASAKATGEMEKLWAGLEGAHKRHDYKKWLPAARKIGKSTTFKVGGHGFSFLHVDWEKTPRGWRIVRVFVCR